MGDAQPLPGGNVLVGWGSVPSFSEYTASGKLLLDAVLPGPDLTYRAELEPWVGLPLTPPSGAARRQSGRTMVYASWNGATRVPRGAWSAARGRSSARPPSPGSRRRSPCRAATSNFRVQAVDRRGRVIGTSEAFGLSS